MQIIFKMANLLYSVPHNKYRLFLYSYYFTDCVEKYMVCLRCVKSYRPY